MLMSSHFAIDIGSNAIRFAAGRLSKQGKLAVFETGREAVRLGESVFREGVLSPLLMDKGVSTIKRFIDHANEIDSESIHIVATSAVREAKNREKFLDRIQKATGTSVEVLSGELEASLITRAVCHTLEFNEGSALIVNIGGGSTELSIVTDGRLVGLESIEVGTVRLLQGKGEKQFSKMIGESVARLDSLLTTMSGIVRPAVFIGTGGNVEAIGKLKKNLMDKSDTNKVTVREFSAILSSIGQLTVEERIERLRLKPDRADVIYPAAKILSVLFEKLEFDELLIPGVGLKEGVLIASLHGDELGDDLLQSGEMCQ